MNRFFASVIGLFLSANLLAQENPTLSAQKIIEQKDLDGDGVLCFMECPSDLSYDFKKIDQNADGYLTASEIEYFLNSGTSKKKKR
ncbi:MAG: hypothetical protein JNJ99_17125 [Crocinitomicaceae bacterium]|nr:hypothetical protein [Crocinitomicaceae bacterium]